MPRIDELRVFMSSYKSWYFTNEPVKIRLYSTWWRRLHTWLCRSQKSRSVNGRNGGGVCRNVRTNLNYRTRNDLIKSDGRQEKSSNRSSITNQRSGSLWNSPIFNLKFANINFLPFARKAAVHGEIFLTLEDTLREIGFHDN